MPGTLVIATLRFKDVERYRRYQAAFPDVFRNSGGTVLAADEQPRQIHGDEANVDKIVIMRFESDEAAHAFIASGKLGKIYMAKGLCYKPRKSIGHKPDGTPPEGLDYNIWTGPAEMKPYFTASSHNRPWLWPKEA